MTRWTPSTTRRALVTGLVLGLTTTGCNNAVPDTGADPGEGGARETAHGIVNGITSKDGALACSLMDATAMNSLTARTRKASCIAAVEAMAGARPTVTAVTVSGETATVTVSGGPAELPSPWRLVRESQHWVLHAAG